MKATNFENTVAELAESIGCTYKEAEVLLEFTISSISKKKGISKAKVYHQFELLKGEALEKYIKEIRKFGERLHHRVYTDANGVVKVMQGKDLE